MGGGGLPGIWLGVSSTLVHQLTLPLFQLQIQGMYLVENVSFNLLDPHYGKELQIWVGCNGDIREI